MSAVATLVFETSTPRASIALAGPDGQVRLRDFTSDRSHNAVLFGPLAELIGGEERVEIGLVLVGSGPGSYSGTRVGIAAAQGVAIARGCPAVAIPSILAVQSAAGGAPILAIGDARRGGFWSARTDSSPDEPALTDADGLENAVRRAADDGIPVFAFEAPEKFPLPPDLASLVRQEFPDAGRLWAAWTASTSAARARWQAAPPQPIYLKPPHITPAKRPWLAAGNSQ